MDTTVRTAYMLQIHNNPEQVNKFIYQLICDNQADVYVHLDKKNYEELRGKLIKNPSVKILEKSINCEWGDISQVDTTLLLLKEVLVTKKKYDYVCLRSGQDLLVKENFKSFLQRNNGKIFMTYRLLEKGSLGFVRVKWPKFTRKRYTNVHPIRVFRRSIHGLYEMGINILPNKNYWPKEFAFYKGSQWFTIPIQVADFMIDYLEKNEWYYKFFENTLVPDESFFHTLIMNSPYKKEVVNNNLFFFKWGETLSERNSPQYLRMEDITAIENSGQFFARKFDRSIDNSVIDYLAERISFSS